MENRGLHMGHIATIQVNPEKSKHLETANAKVFGHLVDFVHLRTETYSDDSRNPSVVCSLLAAANCWSGTRHHCL